VSLHGWKGRRDVHALSKCAVVFYVKFSGLLSRSEAAMITILNAGRWALPAVFRISDNSFIKWQLLICLICCLCCKVIYVNLFESCEKALAPKSNSLVFYGTFCSLNFQFRLPFNLFNVSRKVLLPSSGMKRAPTVVYLNFGCVPTFVQSFS
jgi:hypothetical protein